MKNIYLAVGLCFCLAFSAPCLNGQNLLIKNGTLLTVTQGTLTNGDILILDGIIKKIGNLEDEQDEFDAVCPMCGSMSVTQI